MKCFAQNTKRTTHSSHASYPSISLPVSKVLILGKSLKNRRGLSSCGTRQLPSKLNAAVMKRHIMDYQGLFLKQYGAQRLSLLPVIPQGEFLFISCFFTHMLSSTG